MSLVQNWWFIKAQGQDPWAERAAAPGYERWLIIYHGVGGDEEKGRLRKHFHMSKKTCRKLEAPPPSSQGCPHYHCVLINELQLLSYVKEDSQDIGGPAIVKPRLSILSLCPHQWAAGPFLSFRTARSAEECYLHGVGVTGCQLCFVFSQPSIPSSYSTS